MMADYNQNRSAPLMEEVVVTGKRGGRRADPRHYVPEMPDDKVGINLESVRSQAKSTLWDLLGGYLEGGEYSMGRFKEILNSRPYKVPIDLPGDYGVDIDINKMLAGSDVKDDYRITLKKNF